MENGISTIIVTYNRFDALKKCVASVKINVDSLLEIIIVNNGSPISSSDFPDCLILNNKKNLGVSKSRELGYRYSKYRYALFLDDDAVISETKMNLSNLIQKHLENEQFWVLCAPVFNCDTADSMAGLIGEDGTTLFFIGAFHIFDKKKITAPLYDINFSYGHEDLYLSLKIISMGGRIKTCYDIVVLHYRELDNRNYMYMKKNSIINNFAIKYAFFGEKYGGKLEQFAMSRLEALLGVKQAKKVFNFALNKSNSLKNNISSISNFNNEIEYIYSNFGTEFLFRKSFSSDDLDVDFIAIWSIAKECVRLIQNNLNSEIFLKMYGTKRIVVQYFIGEAKKQGIKVSEHDSSCINSTTLVLFSGSVKKDNESCDTITIYFPNILDRKLLKIMLRNLRKTNIIPEGNFIVLENGKIEEAKI